MNMNEKLQKMQEFWRDHMPAAMWSASFPLSFTGGKPGHEIKDPSCYIHTETLIQRAELS